MRPSIFGADRSDGGGARCKAYAEQAKRDNGAHYPDGRSDPSPLSVKCASAVHGQRCSGREGGFGD